MKPVIIEGMHGLGDNVHQRAVVRRLLATEHDVWLKTSWPCLYHDLVGERLHLLDRGRTLRIQQKMRRASATASPASARRAAPPPCPSGTTTHRSAPPARSWAALHAFYAGWATNLKHIAVRACSMSGWTEMRLGAPTAQWLEEMKAAAPDFGLFALLERQQEKTNEPWYG